MNIQMTHSQQVNRSDLRRILVNQFDDGEFRDLCFDLDIPYDNLPGASMKDKARELIAYCERHEHWMELVTAVCDARPYAPQLSNLETQEVSHPVSEHGRASVAHTAVDAPSISWSGSMYCWTNQTTTVAWRNDENDLGDGHEEA